MTDKWDEAVEIFTLGAEMSLNYHDEPIQVCYSGGKDSDVLLEVAKASEQQFVLVYNITTVDSPDTLRHINEVFRREEQNGVKCLRVVPTYQGKPINMWDLIVKKTLPPLRTARYCCEILKERSLPQHVVATGVRWAESVQRSNRKPVEVLAPRMKDRVGYDPTSKQLSFTMDNTAEHKIAEYCSMGRKTAVNPIIKFTDREIWNIIYDCHIKVNPMYEKGYDRVGCIGCPMASLEDRTREFKDYPHIKEKYIQAFDKLVKTCQHTRDWKSGQECFDWWMTLPPPKSIPNGIRRKR